MEIEIDEKCPVCGYKVNVHRRETTTAVYCEQCCYEHSVVNLHPYHPQREAIVEEEKETFRMRKPKGTSRDDRTKAPRRKS